MLLQPEREKTIYDSLDMQCSTSLAVPKIVPLQLLQHCGHTSLAAVWKYARGGPNKRSDEADYVKEDDRGLVRKYCGPYYSRIRKSGQTVHNRYQSSLYLYWLELLMIHRLGYFTDFSLLFEYVHHCYSCSLFVQDAQEEVGLAQHMQGMMLLLCC